MPTPVPEQPKVTIVGGGIAGLTAALRLAQRGYAVSVYELTENIGGNLGYYHPEDGPDPEARYYDVYTHMYSDFYHNFWQIAEGDLGMKRGMGQAFEPRHSVKSLRLGNFPQFNALADTGAPQAVWQNLMSGLASPAEMFLWYYSMIDALSLNLDDDWWDNLSVEGYYQTRYYDTEMVDRLHEMILMTIWSIHSSQTSMGAYRRFMNYRFRLPTPMLWLLTGNLYKKLIQPLQQKIMSYGATIKTCTEVTQVRVGGETETGCRIEELTLQIVQYDPDGRKYNPVGTPTSLTIEEGEAVILAVPPQALYNLIVAGDKLDQTIYSKRPKLANVRELSGATIPVLYLAFKKKLPHIPKENVLLLKSRYDLTFLDLSQIWHDDPLIKFNGEVRTVLALSASDDFALPAGRPHEEFGLLMIQELHEYIGGFECPATWGDQNSDIDWEFSYFNPSLMQLFTNVVSGLRWQPHTHYPENISNLYFAGDCVQNDIEMATVESAVVSGLLAASEIWKKKKLGAPINIVTPKTWPRSIILALNTLMLPSACAAKSWSSASKVLPSLAKGDMFTASEAAGLAIFAPAAMVANWYITVGGNLYDKSFFRKS